MIADVSSADTSFAAQSARHMAYLVGLVPGFLDSLTWSRERILTTQRDALGRLLAHAKQNSPWHRERLAAIDPGTATVEDLARIPPMTKRDLMEHWDDIVCVPGITLAEAEEFLKTYDGSSYFKDTHFLVTSSGTNGLMAVLLFDWHAWAINRGSPVRSVVPIMQKYGRPSTLRQASVSANAATHFSSLMTKTFSPPDNPMARFSISLPVEKIVAGLNEVQPQFLHLISSYLPVLCQEAEERRLRIDPKIVMCTSEPVLESARERARKIWGAPVLTCWSTSETSGTFPCTVSGGFHIAEDINVIELVDEAGEPVGPGQLSSKVLVTNLYNMAMPLIRYEIEDIFEMLLEPCGCGSQYAAVKRVYGRTYEVFVYPGRAAVHPGTLETAIMKLPKVAAYQMRQTTGGVDVDIVSGETLDVETIGREIADQLTGLGITDPVINVRQTPHIERTANGKLQRYIALRT